MTSQEKAERFGKSAPALNQKEIEQINNLFPAYAFRRSRTREIWTTCCGRHGTIGDTDAEAIASKEKEDMMEQVEQLRKKLAMASSSEMTVFKLYFDACQTNLSKMAECIGKMVEAGNAADAEKLKRAMTALLKSRLEENE